VYVPPATESYGYDTDGNLATYGRWTYSWDGENRLVEMKRDTSVPTLSSRLRLRFEYDHLGRRIRKGFDTHNGTDWVEQTDTIFLYDGWNVMGELNANASNAKLRTYVWGLDLSGSSPDGPRGAGGVGGLLKVTDYVGGTTHHFVAYDGNGNVAALADGTSGALTARYEYGPFGEAIRTTGPGTTPMAEKNPFRFSAKYTDDQSGFLYYGYRHYNPSTGRWLSRDPIEEKGGRNLYAFATGNGVNRVDYRGLITCEMTEELSVPEVAGRGNRAEAHMSTTGSGVWGRCRWPSCKSKLVNHKPSCRATIQYAPGVNPGDLAAPGTGITTTVRQHEQEHVTIYEVALIGVDMEYRPWTRKCVGGFNNCEAAVGSYLMHVWAYYMSEAKVQHAELDCRHGDENACDSVAFLKDSARSYKGLMLQSKMWVIQECK